MNKKETFQGYLHSKGLKFTRQREDIVNYFLKANDHFSAEELYRKIQKNDPQIGYATVYRTLKLLVEVGLAIENQFGDGITRFEPLHEGEHHDHLVCLKCGKIIEFENNKIEKLQLKVAKDNNFNLTKHKCVLYGYCSRCSK
jgi:Fur family ferric uptake transcriptional regulator